MPVNFLLSLLAAVISGIFSIVVLNRYRERGGMHLLVWGIGLVLYSLSTLAQAILFQGWNALFFRLWYWAGAMIVAAWLGQGTIHLLVRRGRIAMILLGVLTVASLIALVLVLQVPLNPGGGNFTLPNWISTYSRVLPPSETPEGVVRRLTVLFNVYGTIGLVGGAIYSGWLFLRKQILPNRVLGNVLIAAGGLSNALGGTLARLGGPEFLPLSQLLGAGLIFAGFWLAVSGAPQPAAQQAQV